MIIRGPRPRSQFVMLANDLVRNEALTFRARGLLAYLLSHEDGWRTDAAYLASQNPEGRKAIQTAMSELEAARYLVRVKWQDQRGRWRTDQFVFEEPVPDGFNPLSLITPPESEPDLLSGLIEHEDEQQVKPQVTPEVGFRSPVDRPPVNRPPVHRPPVDWSLNRKTNKNTSPMAEVGTETTGHATAGDAPTTANVDGDEPPMPGNPWCRQHPGGTPAPCAACSQARTAAEQAGKVREVWERKEARRVDAERRAAEDAAASSPEARAAALAAARRAVPRPGRDPSRLAALAALVPDNR